MRSLSLVAVFALALSSPLAAQTNPPTPPIAPPSSTTVATSAAQPMATKLTSEQATAWKDKPVYSSDNKKIGEVKSFERAADGAIIDLLADIGGFIGIGETRIRLTPPQFSLLTDRVVLTLTADQAKALPKVQK